MTTTPWPAQNWAIGAPPSSDDSRCEWGHAPIREIATVAGVGIETIDPHFPSRSDLVTDVYRHQIEACEAAGPQLLAERASASEALRLLDGIVQR